MKMGDSISSAIDPMSRSSIRLISETAPLVGEKNASVCQYRLL